MSTKPIIIAQITDLHMLPGHRSKQEWVRELAALDPDLVLLTGDNLAHHEAVPSVLHALQPADADPILSIHGSAHIEDQGDAQGQGLGVWSIGTEFNQAIGGGAFPGHGDAAPVHEPLDLNRTRHGGKTSRPVRCAGFFPNIAF